MPATAARVTALLDTDRRIATAPVLRPARVAQATPDRTRTWQIAVIVAVTAVLVVTGVRHEPWFDEAQSWLIARDASLWDLLAVRMRHEGSTPLWQLLLMVPAKLGAPYRTVSVASGLAMLAGAWLLVRHAPFPVWARATLPFSYFLLYQYGVVARSYALLAPLLFAAAIAFPSRREHPWRLTLPLLATAAVSMHGLIIAVGWEVWRLAELRREWSATEPEERRRRCVPAVAMGITVILAMAMLWPTGDISGGGTWHISLAPLGTVLSSSPLLALLQWAGAAAVAATLPWMRRRGVLGLFAIPAAALFALFTVRYFSPWHAGVIVVLWLAVLWIAWRRPTLVPDPPRRAALPVLALGVVAAGELVWTAQSVQFDLVEPYSGAPALADYIRAHHLEHRIDAVGKWVVAVLPYFPDVVISDYNGGSLPAYYPWSHAHDPLPSTTDAVVARGAEAIVVAVESRSTSKVRCLPGYRVDAIFSGHVFIGDHRYESETYVVFLRDPASTASRSQTCAVVPV